MRAMNDEAFIKFRFRTNMGEILNLSNPITFDEKLQWLKLNDRKPIYTEMVDKAKAKEFAARIIGEKYIIPTLGLWKHYDDIAFESLPGKFVLKCTHDSGSIVICKDKEFLDHRKAKKVLERGLKSEFFYAGREWPYKDVEPMIIAEDLLEDKTGEVKDYKFFCFNGKMKYMKVDFGRFTDHRANYYDREMRLQAFGEAAYPPDFSYAPPIPNNVDQMIVLAEKLAEGIPFLRVDFYNIAGQIFFGELTFYPTSGFGKIVPEEWDKKLGELIILDC